MKYMCIAGAPCGAVGFAFTSLLELHSPSLMSVYRFDISRFTSFGL